MKKEEEEDRLEQFGKYIGATARIHARTYRGTMDYDDAVQIGWECYYATRDVMDALPLRNALRYFSRTYRGRVAEYNGFRRQYRFGPRVRLFCVDDEKGGEEKLLKANERDDDDEEFEARREILRAFIRDYLMRRMVFKNDRNKRVAVLAALDNITVSEAAGGVDAKPYKTLRCALLAFTELARKEFGEEAGATLKNYKRVLLDAAKRADARREASWRIRAGQYGAAPGWTFQELFKEKDAE